MSANRVGVVGVGLMGLGMAQSLRRAGFSVSVCDLDPQRIGLAKEFGCQEAQTAAMVAQTCSQIFIVVVNTVQIDSVLAGTNGLLLHLQPNTQVFISSTIAPQDTERFAQLVQARGAHFIDAPISGGPAKAHAGTMSMMLAGKNEQLQKAMPLIKALSGSHFIISEQPGDAAKAKLVNNMLAAAHLVAASEAFALAKHIGLDQEQMLKLVAASSGQSWMADERIGRALKDDLNPRAQMHVLTKDVTLANQMAAQAGMPLRLGELARQIMQEGCDAGYAKKDDAELLHHLSDYMVP